MSSIQLADLFSDRKRIVNQLNLANEVNIQIITLKFLNQIALQIEVLAYHP